MQEGHVCDSECSNKGCWGPGPDKCLECRHVIDERDNTCLGSCLEKPMLYLTEKKSCQPCNILCAEGCTGPVSRIDVLNSCHADYFYVCHSSLIFILFTCSIPVVSIFFLTEWKTSLVLIRWVKNAKICFFEEKWF